MTILKLKILADTINNNDFLDLEKCPITDALQRAGFKVHDGGIDLTSDDYSFHIKPIGYKEMSDKLLSMYKTKHINNPLGKYSSYEPIPIEDFEAELLLTDEQLELMNSTK